MDTKNSRHNLLVVVAHPGDFVWRTAGAIAVHLTAGWCVKIICASLGIKGEAGILWKKSGATLETVAQERLKEANEAANILGANLELLNLNDYPLTLTEDNTLYLSRLMREFQPSIILTHPPIDPGNVDHMNISSMVLQARLFATAPGYGLDTISPPNIYYFEPHQPEQSYFKADLFLDITHMWPLKHKAFEAIASQQNVWSYYERVALQRGAQASRRSSQPIHYAEAFQRAFPCVTNMFAV